MDLKIVILCGGKGERLYPLTNNIPKPLLKIKERPILSYIIEHLSKYDLQELIIATGYKSNKIFEYIENYYPGSNYRLVDSGDVDIVKRIQDCERYIDSDFMVLYGDTISNINIHDQIAFHDINDRPATMAVWPMQSQFGMVDLTDDCNVIEFKEKPKLDKWINIGYFYFKYKMMEMIKKYDSYAVLLRDMAKQQILNAYKHDGIHITVNTLKELADAEKSIVEI